jgi:hypothetical protein
MNQNVAIRFLLILVLASACSKEENRSDSSVFFRLFPSDTSYEPLGAFQPDSDSYIVYGTSPEANGGSPAVIKTDLRGNIIWTKYLPPQFHFCSIQQIKGDSLKIVGVPHDVSLSLYVTEMKDSTLGFVKEYPLDSVLAGPVMPPLFFMNDATGELIIALTGKVNGKDVPSVLRVDGSAVADPLKSYDTGDNLGLDFMVRSFFPHNDGYILTGSSIRKSGSSIVNSYCLRLNSSLEKEWCTILSKPDTFVVVRGAIPEKNSASVILYGSQTKVFTSNFANSGIADLIGTLFTELIDMNGDTSREIKYRQYENMAHACHMIETINGGYLLGATTNELTDFHVVSSNRIYLLSLTDDREEQWHRQFNGFSPFTAQTLSPAADDGFLIGGYEHSGSFLYNMCLLKTDASGNIVTN